MLKDILKKTIISKCCKRWKDVLFLLFLIFFGGCVFGETLQYILSYFKGEINSEIADLPQIKDMIEYIITIIFSYLVYKSSEKSRKLAEEIDKREINKDNEKIRENAFIIYYDFKLALDDIYNIYINENIPKKEEFKLKNNDIPKKMYLSENWITNVAAIREQLKKYNCKTNDLEIKDMVDEVFLLYGDLFTVKKSLELDKKDIETISKISESVLDENLIKNIKLIAETDERVRNKCISITNIQSYRVDEIRKKYIQESALKLKKINNDYEEDLLNIFSNKWLYILNSLDKLTRYGISNDN